MYKKIINIILIGMFLGYTAPTRIIIFSGQSNMVGKGKTIEIPASARVMLPNVTYREKNMYGTGVATSIFDTTGFGPEFSGIWHLVKSFPNEKFLILKAAKGSTTLANWKPGDALYQEAMDFYTNTVNGLFTNSADYEYTAFLWMQGESDAYNTTLANAYETNFSNFIYHIRNDLGVSDLPMVFGEIDPPGASGTATVVQAQKNTAANLVNCYFVGMQGLDRGTSDLIHFSSWGDMELGKRLSREFISNYNLSGGILPTATITNISGVITNNEGVPLSFIGSATDTDGSIVATRLYDSYGLVSTISNSTFSFDLTNLLIGTHLIQVEALDNSGLSGVSSSILIYTMDLDNVAPTVAITSPTNDSLFSNISSINISVDATDSDGTVSAVYLYVDNVWIGQTSSVPYEVNWNNITPGIHQVYAMAIDDDSATNYSSTNTIVFTNISVVNTNTNITSINYAELPHPNPVTGDELTIGKLYPGYSVELFSVNGTLVKTLLPISSVDGYYVRWDLKNIWNVKVKSGIYIVKYVSANGTTMTQKILIP